MENKEPTVLLLLAQARLYEALQDYDTCGPLFKKVKAGYAPQGRY